MHLPAEEKRHVAEISCCAGGTGTETHVFQNGSLAFLFGAPRNTSETHRLFFAAKCVDCVF